MGDSNTQPADRRYLEVCRLCMGEVDIPSGKPFLPMVCAHSMFQCWRRSWARCKTRLPRRFVPPCRYGCWRPGCAFAHDQARERQEHVRDLAEYWAEASRHLGIAKQSATTRPELAKSSSGAGPSWSRANGTNRAAATAAVKCAGETRPSRIVKYSATSESGSELAEDLELARVALQLRRGIRSEMEAWRIFVD